MDMKQYQAEVKATKSDVFFMPIHKFMPAPTSANIPIDVLHAIVGISTESGELLDVAKKAMFYGKAVDFVNLDEEMGDVLWYIAIYANARGTTIEELARVNNQKRFPDKFTTYHANNRNLPAERANLEFNTGKFPDGMQIADDKDE
jgi:NTP pyrophosphatase (non-canonical NTP hydrolase)